MKRAWKLLPAVAGLWMASAGLAHAGDFVASPGCASCAPCGHEKCPPPYIHWMEGPPKIKFKKGCPRPVCDPCNLPHYGYYQTCWGPWPFGPDWSHCRVPTPSQMLPDPKVPPYTPKVPVSREGDGKKGDDGGKGKAPDKPVTPELPEPKKLEDTSYRTVPMPQVAVPAITPVATTPLPSPTVSTVPPSAPAAAEQAPAQPATFRIRFVR
jgi:hypothetical protein